MDKPIRFRKRQKSNAASQQPANVYSYDDFRLFLRDSYNIMKHNDPGCTARAFAARAGFTNPGFLGYVIKGRRTLSKAARTKLSSVFTLNASESEYFSLLVDYGQSKQPDKRDALYRKIQTRRNRSKFSRLNPALSKYYQHAGYPLVYTALMACDFRGDFEKLSRFLYPPMPVHQVKSIIDDLGDWGLVIRHGDGRYRVTQRFLEPPESLRMQSLQLYREWILQAADALIKLPRDARHMSTMLLSMSPGTCKKIKEKIDRIRDEIWNLIEEESDDPSCVMQLNLQYFPRSRKEENV